MNTLDHDLFWHINRDWTNGLLDYLMPVLSAIGSWLPILGLLLIVALWRGGQKVRWMVACLALAIVCSDAIVGNTLKKIIGRQRPSNAMKGVVIRDVAKVKPSILAVTSLFRPTTSKLSGSDPVAPPKISMAWSHFGEAKPPENSSPRRGNSMPSNHTLNMFAAATVIALFYRRLALPMYLLAAAVAYSRIYVGAHWPSDVGVSIVLGILIGLGAVMGIRLIQRKSQSSRPTEKAAPNPAGGPT